MQASWLGFKAGTGWQQQLRAVRRMSRCQSCLCCPVPKFYTSLVLLWRRCLQQDLSNVLAVLLLLLLCWCGLPRQAVVVSSGGKLTVALYTIRDVAPGEELTFDYSSVTESEDEFKQAFCMCSTRHCRGSYLYYTGSKAYMQVLLGGAAGRGSC